MSIFSMQSSIAGAARHRLLERVEVDDEKIDCGDAVRGHCARVLIVGADRQQAAMDFRMQRLDAAVHHFGKSGEIGDVAHRKPGCGERLGGAAGRNELDAVSRKRAGEIDEPGLVRHREKGAAHVAQLVGHEFLGSSPAPPWWVGYSFKSAARKKPRPYPLEDGEGKARSGVNHDSRVRADPAYQASQHGCRHRDAAGGGTEIGPGHVNEHGAAAAGDARPGVVVDLDDDVVERVGAGEAVAGGAGLEA